MRLSWLEQLTKEGRVSEAQKASIYESCGQLVKVAQTPEEGALKITQMLAPFVVPTLLGFAPFAAGLALERRERKKNEATHHSGYQHTLNSLLADPVMGGQHRELALKRLNEVAEIAPTVAANTPLLTAILKKKLHSGFSHDDLTGLAKIQATYSPNYGHQQDLIPKFASDDSAALAGKMAADSFLLCKEANILSPKNMRFLGNAAKQTLFATSIPLLLAAGAGVANSIVAARDNRNQRQNLQNSFNIAMDPNHPGTASLNGAPERAREAFESLVHFAPHVALQPVAARTFMNKLIQLDPSANGALQTPDLKELTEIERNLRDIPGGNAFVQGFVPALGLTGFQDSLSRSLSVFQEPMIHSMEADVAKRHGLVLNNKKYETTSDFAARKKKELAAEQREAAKHKRENYKAKTDLARNARDTQKNKFEMARTMKSLNLQNKSDAKALFKQMGIS